MSTPHVYPTFVSVCVCVCVFMSSSIRVCRHVYESIAVNAIHAAADRWEGHVFQRLVKPTLTSKNSTFRNPVT